MKKGIDWIECLTAPDDSVLVQLSASLMLTSSKGIAALRSLTKYLWNTVKVKHDSTFQHENQDCCLLRHISTLSI